MKVVDVIDMIQELDQLQDSLNGWPSCEPNGDIDVCLSKDQMDTITKLINKERTRLHQTEVVKP